MSLVIYNTLSKRKEEFIPLTPGQVKMYLCGPTVYGLLHVGNFRGPIFFNLVRNWLERLGFAVEFAYNYTDVDDRIIERAQKEGVSSSEISERYIAEFEKDFAAVKLRPHTHNPKVTETMGPIVTIVEELIKKQRAYVTSDGEVLYSVRSFPDYGKLSGRNVDELQAGARVEVDAKKRDPLDFALWKPAKPGEPKWPSPWCDGRPGWHIECSAMAKSIFGDSIDIHGGGSDLIFPHHENEIAQSEGASERPFVRYWMHNHMLNFGDKKMSKSLGNILSVRDFLSKYDAEILKFMMLSVHYRSMSDFSEPAIGYAIGGLAKIYSALSLAEKTLDTAATLAFSQPATSVSSSATSGAAFSAAMNAATADVAKALNDDFNTPEMFAAIYSVVKSFNANIKPGQKPNAETLATAKAFRDWILSNGELLSLFQEPANDYLQKLDARLLVAKGIDGATIQALVAERSSARANKDYRKSDELRDKLIAMGITLHDSATGTSWEVTK